MTTTPAARDGRQARWDQHKEERRRQIIDAAIAVVEESGPDAEVRVQQIAERAGLSRTVVYRHFEDRADLDRAVQATILDAFWAQLLPEITLDGTVPQIIERGVGTYVRWAVAHPALHRLADHDVTSGGRTDHSGGPLEQGLERVAGQIAGIVQLGVVALGGTLSEEGRASIDPLAYGMVGAAFSSVRRWLVHPDPTLTPDAVITLVSQTLWFAVDGHARRFGVRIDPDRPVQDIAGEVLAGLVEGGGR
ncbi:transcriptional regulator, TetR family [Nocardioides terrae]|uniref:Transcriptional regulator, TetR family n=1 Tax=Nocardioides terrae TaxID=574651 RepID=A0A1I1M3V4_9ACTN|nr:TetR/AcrR family transcriptional regulator [Nocardioides terrae]SFC77303.1 transcriptional regulator, TetR family [Nocardioides terrae]